jgi:hypothetical protein
MGAGGSVMVWGMGLPESFGLFWPSGEFEGGGWYNRLPNYFYEQPPEIQKALFDSPLEPMEAMDAYTLYVTDKFISEVGARKSPRPEHPPYTPIHKDELPATFDIEKTQKVLGSLIALNGRIVAVDDALKDIIERFEPSLHHFYPIKIVMPKGNIFPKNFYILVIGQYFDSFVPEKSKDEAFRELPNSGGKLLIRGGPKNNIPGLALSQNIYGDAHLWRERRLGPDLTCFSDALAAEIENAGLHIPKLRKMKDA